MAVVVIVLAMVVKVAVLPLVIVVGEVVTTLLNKSDRVVAVVKDIK